MHIRSYVPYNYCELFMGESFMVAELSSNLLENINLVVSLLLGDHSKRLLALMADQSFISSSFTDRSLTFFANT